MKIRTIKRNGKTWKAPIKNGGNRRERQLSRKEIQDLTGVGIINPGSLEKFGYHISIPFTVTSQYSSSTVSFGSIIAFFGGIMAI